MNPVRASGNPCLAQAAGHTGWPFRPLIRLKCHLPELRDVPQKKHVKIPALLLALALTVHASAQRLSTTHGSFAAGTPVQVSWEGAKSARDWIGIYAQDVTPSAKGHRSPSWAYTNQTQTAPSQVSANGTMTLSASLAPGDYVVYLFADDGYTIVRTASFSVSDGKKSSLSTTDIKAGQPLWVNFSGAGNAATAWIGVYPKGKFGKDYTRYIPLEGKASGNVRFTELPAGEYDLYLFPNNGYQHTAKTGASITL